MRQTRIFISLLAVFIGLPIGILQTYLLYQYVHVPQIVWILWIINLPITILLQMFVAIANNKNYE